MISQILHSPEFTLPLPPRLIATALTLALVFTLVLIALPAASAPAVGSTVAAAAR